MRGKHFKRLVKLKIIQLVNPSKVMSKSYLLKSKESLLSSRILYDNKQYNDSIALSYFSMYNSLLGLLYFCGIKSENHNVSISLLRDLFNINNIQIKDAKKNRKDKQYYPSELTSKIETFNAIRESEDFNSMIRDLIERMDSGKLMKYREDFLSLIK